MGLGVADDRSAWAVRLARTPFASALAKGAPLFVACGEPSRLVFATPSTLDAFGVKNSAELEAQLFSADSPAAQRLQRLACELPEGAPPRLERLRFFVARKPLNLSWLCTRLARDGETWFVAAHVMGVDPVPDEEETAPEPAPPTRASTRFVWRLDEAGRFQAMDPALAQRFAANAPRAGETLDALSTRLALDPDWRERIAARETFSQMEVVWPEATGDKGEVARLSGAPLFSGGQTYRGFRGFGLLTGEIRPLARPVPVAPPLPPANANAAPLPGDAAALLNLLQRQHGQGQPAAAPNAATAPALAIIAALAALLQAKPVAPSRPKAAPEPPPPSAAPTPSAPPPSGGATPPSGGAEIVVLRPHAAPPEAPAARESENVALSSTERDAFKEIARALGVNVRPARSGEGPPRPETADEPEAAPSEEDIAALIDILPIAVLVVAGGEALYANKTLLDFVGYADLADLCARGGVKAMFRGRDPRTLAPGGVVVGIPVVAADERILTVDAQVRPASWRGQPAELVAMRRSRDAEHQAELRALERETAMHSARARDYSAALDAARDGVVRIDRQGRLLGLNRGAEMLFGFGQNEAAGESFLTLLAPASQAAASAALECIGAGEAGGLQTFDAVARSREGRQFPVRAELGRFANQPEPDYFLLLTDRSREEAASQGARTALEQAEKVSAAKTELLSRVSHEVRTPLHAILGFAEVILEERFGPVGVERYRDYIRDIHASGKHVLSLVNDLLDLTKIELGKIELEFSPTDVNATVRECVSLMQPQAARERVIMRLSLYERLPNVMADPRSLKQIMLNLMTNAVKYNEPGGQVIVSTALDEAGAVVIRVRDTGVGMNESELAIALEPFRRVPGVKAVEGTGLGLPLTKALAEANHADFSIKSRKNQGTLVEIAFPLRKAAQ